jgi:hypothetical protein
MPVLGKSRRPYLEKKTKAKRARGMIQMVKCLARMCEDLGSNISTAKKKKLFKNKYVE